MQTSTNYLKTNVNKETWESFSQNTIKNLLIGYEQFKKAIKNLEDGKTNGSKTEITELINKLLTENIISEEKIISLLIEDFNSYSFDYIFSILFTLEQYPQLCSNEEGLFAVTFYEKIEKGCYYDQTEECECVTITTCIDKKEQWCKTPSEALLFYLKNYFTV